MNTTRQVPEVATIKTEVFCLNEGAIVFQYPAKMTAAEYEDVVAWLAIIQRKIARSVRDNARVKERDEALAVMADELTDLRRAEQKYNAAKDHSSDAVFDGGSLWLCSRTQANAIAAEHLSLADERWNRGAPPASDPEPASAIAECAVCRGRDDVVRIMPESVHMCKRCRA